MPEWTKILVSTLVGLTAGLVSEPLRAAVQQHFAKRRISRILVDEILSVSGGAAFAFKLHAANLIFHTERFDYIYEKERQTFYLLKGYSFIIQFFTTIKSFTGKALPDSVSDDRCMLLGAFEGIKYQAEHDYLGRYFKRHLLGPTGKRLVLAASLFSEFPEVTEEQK